MVRSLLPREQAPSYESSSPDWERRVRDQTELEEDTAAKMGRLRFQLDNNHKAAFAAGSKENQKRLC